MLLGLLALAVSAFALVRFNKCLEQDNDVEGLYWIIGAMVALMLLSQFA